MSPATDAVLIVANVPGDSDSVGSIAGGILGAMCPRTVNQDWVRIVESVNGHELFATAHALTGLRH